MSAAFLKGSDIWRLLEEKLIFINIACTDVPLIVVFC